MVRNRKLETDSPAGNNWQGNTKERTMEANNIGEHLFCANCGAMLQETKHTLIGERIKCTNCNAVMSRPIIVVEPKAEVKPVVKKVVKKVTKKVKKK